MISLKSILQETNSIIENQLKVTITNPRCRKSKFYKNLLSMYREEGVAYIHGKLDEKDISKVSDLFTEEELRNCFHVNIDPKSDILIDLSKVTDIDISLVMISVYNRTNNPVIFLPIEYIGVISEVLKRLERYDLLLKIEEF